MAIIHENEENFRTEQKKFHDIYKDYRSTLSKRLWYAEQYTGKNLASLLERKLTIDASYWGKDNIYIEEICGNVSRHLDLHQQGLEKLRLSAASPEDMEWRGKDPAFWSQIVDRFNERITPYKIDQTVSMASLTEDQVTVQRSSYLDQFGSNIFCDEPLEDGSTLRMRDRVGGGLPPFQQSHLANTIGVAALIVDKNGVPLLRWRRHDEPTRRMAVMESGWHCTSSGVLTWQDFVGHGTKNTTLRSVINGVIRETEREAGFFAHEKHEDQDLFTIKPIAFARELKRAGKPQFFFIIEFPNHEAEEIRDELLKRKKTEGNEYGGRKPMGLLGRTFGLRAGERKEDIRIDPRLNIRKLTHAELMHMSKSEPEEAFTFECYANLFFACGTSS